MGAITHGGFAWYDLMTDDLEGARAFYPGVTGWGLMPWADAPSEMPYTMWTVGETPIGGMMALPDEAKAEGAPPHWLGYISTDDVERTTERAAELGARILLEPEDVPGVGRFSILLDPQGAVVAFFTPERTMERPDEPRPGDVSWHELATTDREAAWAFYAELFGWDVSNDVDMGEAGIYRIYSQGGRDRGAVFAKTADMPGPPAWTYYVRTPDLDGAAEACRQGGGAVVVGPMEVPGGDRIAVCTDPDGAFFALHARGAS